MNTLDIILVAITIAALIAGFRKGIIKQVSDVAAVLSGIVVCRLFPERATQLGKIASSVLPADNSCEWITQTAGYILLFLIVCTGIHIAARLLKTVTHVAMLGPVDRLCGGLFMAAKCLLGLSIVMNIWIFISPRTLPVDGSHPKIRPLQEAVINFAPKLLGVCIDYADTANLPLKDLITAETDEAAPPQ